MFDLSIVLSTKSLAPWWRVRKPTEGTVAQPTGGRVVRDGENHSSPLFSAAVAGVGHPLAAG